MKRFLAIIMSLIVAATPYASITALANDGNDEIVITDDARLVNISSHVETIRKSGVAAVCYSSVTAKSKCKITINMYLQKKDGASYVTKHDWTATGTATSLSIEKKPVIDITAKYRLYVHYQVGNEQYSATAYLS